MGGIEPCCVYVDFYQCSISKSCRHEPLLELFLILGIIVESVTWVTEGSLRQNGWITDTSVTLKENEILEALNYEIGVPCPLQWRLVWFSAPTNLHHKFVSNGTKIEKLRKIVNRSIF